MKSDAHNLERWISLSLRFGVWGSAVLMASGLIMTAVQSGSNPATTDNPTLSDLFGKFLSGALDGIAIMDAGLILLMFTPFLRVLTALAGFVSEKDTKFSIISLVVFLMLAGELVYSLR